MKKKCLQCGVEFEVKHSFIKIGGGKYCSIKCVAKSKTTRIKKKCLQCNIEFEVYPSDIKRGRGKYCSMVCRVKSRTTRIKKICPQCGIKFENNISADRKYCSRECGYNSPTSSTKSKSFSKSRAPKIEKKCPQCGVKFKVNPSAIKRGQGKHCSRECASMARTTRIKKKCLQCGIEFEICPSHIKKGGGKYCSRICTDKSKITKIKKRCLRCGIEFKTHLSKDKKYCSTKCSHLENSGENCSLWVDGKSFAPYSLNWNNTFRKSIRRRDAYLCVICDRHQDEFNRSHCVHHIDGDKMNTTKENCISLCHRHHMIVEKSGKAQSFWGYRFRKMLTKIHGYKYKND